MGKTGRVGKGEGRTVGGVAGWGEDGDGGDGEDGGDGGERMGDPPTTIIALQRSSGRLHDRAISYNHTFVVLQLGQAIRGPLPCRCCSFPCCQAINSHDQLPFELCAMEVRTGRKRCHGRGCQRVQGKVQAVGVQATGGQGAVRGCEQVQGQVQAPGMQVIGVQAVRVRVVGVSGHVLFAAAGARGAGGSRCRCKVRRTGYLGMGVRRCRDSCG